MSLREDRQRRALDRNHGQGRRDTRPSRQAARWIPVKRGDPHALSASGIMTIFQARDGQMWVGTYGGGANILDPATGLVRQLPVWDGARRGQR